MDINLNVTINSPILTELLKAAGVAVAAAPKGNAAAPSTKAAETTAPTKSAAAAAVEAEKPKAEEPAKEEKKAAGKAKKPTAEEAKSASEEEKASKAKAEALAFDEGADLEATLENCRLIAKKLSFVADLDTAHAVIKGFGVAKIQDLPDDKYEDFIDECKKKLSSKKDNMFD